MPDGVIPLLGLAADLKVGEGGGRVEEGAVGEEVVGEAGLHHLQVGDAGRRRRRREGGGGAPAALHQQQEQDEETAQQEAPHPAHAHHAGSLKR